MLGHRPCSLRYEVKVPIVREFCAEPALRDAPFSLGRPRRLGLSPRGGGARRRVEELGLSLSAASEPHRRGDRHPDPVLGPATAGSRGDGFARRASPRATTFAGPTGTAAAGSSSIACSTTSPRGTTRPRCTTKRCLERSSRDGTPGWATRFWPPSPPTPTPEPSPNSCPSTTSSVTPV